MQNKNKTQPSVTRSFYWQIPGDVPAYRSQPDPYQASRSLSDPAFQQATPASTNTAANEASPIEAKRLRWFLLVLLLVSAGFMAYQLHVSATAPPVVHQEPHTPPVVVSQSVVQDAPKKVFTLTLGEQTRTAESTLRVVIHTVVKGDTLWDIAEAYVKDPFRYPELASLSNIKNPDLIYPYNLVRIHIYE